MISVNQIVIPSPGITSLRIFETLKYNNEIKHGLTDIFLPELLTITQKSTPVLWASIKRGEDTKFEEDMLRLMSLLPRGCRCYH